MAKIEVPRRLERITEEISVKENDLILVTRKSTGDKKGYPFFGLFTGFSADGKCLEISNSYSLRPTELFGGLQIPVIVPVQEDSFQGKRYFRLPKSPEERFAYVKLTRWIKEILSGKDNIVGFLRTLKGYEAHADWISRLEKPYLEGAEE